MTAPAFPTLTKDAPMTEAQSLRMRCLDLAVEHFKLAGGRIYRRSVTVIDVAEAMEDYVRGPADEAMESDFSSVTGPTKPSAPVAPTRWGTDHAATTGAPVGAGLTDTAA